MCTVERLAEIFGTSSDPLLYCLDPTCFAKYWWEKSIPILVLSSFLHHTYLACCRWATFARNPVDQFVYSRTARMRLSPAALVSEGFCVFHTDGDIVLYGLTWSEAGDRMAFVLSLFCMKKILAESKQTDIQALSNVASSFNIQRRLCFSCPSRAHDGQYSFYFLGNR